MKSVLKTLIQSTAIAAGLLAGGVAAADGSAAIGAATFNDQGAPLTPHGLNNGKAGFPEYHHVYVNPDAFAVYQRTGTFPDGTVIAKELVLLQKGDFKDGSKKAPSGRGYFAGEFQGMDVMVKDTTRFKATNGWGFFNFGHHAPPYIESARAASADSCASCHSANAGKGMVFKTYYPVLR
jgi:hypothetical protein